MSSDKGQLIVISAPSGAGKTSIIKNVIKKLNDENRKSKFSVSHTTRLPREVILMAAIIFLYQMKFLMSFMKLETL